MKKALLIMMSVMAISFMFAGCGGKKDDTQSSNTSVGDSPVSSVVSEIGDMIDPNDQTSDNRSGSDVMGTDSTNS